MSISKFLRLVWLVCLPIGACNTSEPTTAILSNEYPPGSAAHAADSTAVYKGWWSVAQFPEPVPAGQVSDPVRIVQGTDYGYALLAPGWDVTAGTPPTALIPVRSTQKLNVERGDVLTFVVSDQTTLGDCRAGRPLPQEDADFLTQHIFPKQFEGLTYDAATCTSTPVSMGEAGAGSEP